MMTPIEALILLLEEFGASGPRAQLAAVGGCITALGGSVVFAWRKGQKNAAELVETNSKLKQELEDSLLRVKKIEREIEEHHRILALLKAQEPAAILVHAVANKMHARETLSDLFEQLATAVAICCREMAMVEIAQALDAKDWPHLARAQQLAKAAVHLSPEDNGGLQDFLAEIAAISADWEEEHGASSEASRYWNVAFDYVGAGGPEVAVPLIQRLNEGGLRRYQEGHYSVTAVLLRRAALLAHRTLGPEHPETLATRNSLAVALTAQGRPAEAEPILREVLALQEKLLGLEHPETLGTRHNLAYALSEQGHPAEAETMLHEVLVVGGTVLGREHPSMLTTRHNLARALTAQGRPAEA